MLARAGRGDTIIEVLLAVTVFSLVSVGSMTIMNRSANAAQQAIEITLVRQQIDAQVEALRAAHQAYSRLTTEDARDASVWHSVTGPAADTISVADACPSQTTFNTRNAFIMNPQSATMLTAGDGAVVSMDNDGAPVFPRFNAEESKGYGLWIERNIPPGGFVPAAYDFRVRACWDGPSGGNAPMQIETTVRLYDVQ